MSQLVWLICSFVIHCQAKQAAKCIGLGCPFIYYQAKQATKYSVYAVSKVALYGVRGCSQFIKLSLVLAEDLTCSF